MKNKHSVMIPKWLGDIWYNTWWNPNPFSGPANQRRVPHTEILLESCYIEPKLGGLKHPGLGVAKKLNY